jgi:hypothetical protein
MLKNQKVNELKDQNIEPNASNVKITFEEYEKFMETLEAEKKLGALERNNPMAQDLRELKLSEINK